MPDSNNHARTSELEKSITAHRKGRINVKARPGTRVTVEQVKHEFWFGSAITNSIFNGSAAEQDRIDYLDRFLQNFNAGVTEVAVKWHAMEQRRGEVDYTIVDAILEWTEKHDIPLRAHNLFWGIPRYVQPWLKELSDEELERAVKQRAETFTARYRGRFAEYDLNNEMVHGNYYEDRLGPDITRKMAEWAQNGDPDIRLFLNEYDILTGVKLADYLDLGRLLQEQGVPIAGIGAQGHLHAETFDREQLKNALDSLAQFGLPIRVTEFNVPGQRSKFFKDRDLKMSQEEEEVNARELEDFYRICFAHPAVEGILMWGFWEGANWIPASSLYRRDWTLNPTGEAYRNLVFNEWWTRENGEIDRAGELSIPAFFGNYKVTANGTTREADLTKAAGEVDLVF